MLERVGLWGRIFVAGFGLWLCGSLARAQPRPLGDAVSVARAGACLTQPALTEHLRAWLGRDGVDARLSVVVDETGTGASFVVLRDGEPRAARRFDSLPRDCADRRAAVALAIAIAVDAAVLEGLVAASPPEPPSPAPPEPRGPPPEPPLVHVEMVAEAQILLEVLPTAATAWQAGPRLVFGDTVELGVAAALTSVAGATLGPGSVDTQLAGGRLDLCLRRAVHPVVLLRGCAGVTAGAGIGRGRGVSGAREVIVPFVGVVARAGVALRLHEVVALELSFDGVVSVVRPRFDLVDADGVPVNSALLPLGGGAGALGLAVRF